MKNIKQLFSVANLKQQHVFAVLIICIIIMTIKALTLTGEYHRRFAALEERIKPCENKEDLQQGALMQEANLKKQCSNELEQCRNEVEKYANKIDKLQVEMQNLRKKIEHHQHSKWNKKVLFE